MGTIRDAANVTYADGPSSSPSQPRKDGAEGIRALFGTVDDENEARKAETASLDTRIDALNSQVAGGLKPIVQIDLATTGNVTLSGEQTIDGTLTSASRVLVWQNTDEAENGAYLTDASAWTRLADFDSGAELIGARWQIAGGDTLIRHVFAVQNLTAPEVGTDDIIIADFGTFDADAVTESVGAGDAGKVTALDAAGKLDNSFFPDDLDLGGVPTAPTASPGTDTTQIATTEFVTDAVAGVSTALPTEDTDLLEVHGVTLPILKSDDGRAVKLATGSGIDAKGALVTGEWAIRAVQIEAGTAPAILVVEPDGRAARMAAVPTDPLLVGSDSGIFPAEGSLFTKAQLDEAQALADAERTRLVEQDISALKRTTAGWRVILYHGQSFDASSDNARTFLTAAIIALKNYVFNAVSVSLDGRCVSNGDTFQTFNSESRDFYRLRENMRGGTNVDEIVSQNDYEIGDYATNCRGSWPAVAATFVRQWLHRRWNDLPEEIDETLMDVVASGSMTDAAATDVFGEDSDGEKRIHDYIKTVLPEALNEGSPVAGDGETITFPASGNVSMDFLGINHMEADNRANGGDGTSNYIEIVEGFISRLQTVLNAETDQGGDPFATLMLQVGNPGYTTLKNVGAVQQGQMADDISGGSQYVFLVGCKHELPSFGNLPDGGAHPAAPNSGEGKAPDFHPILAGSLIMGVRYGIAAHYIGDREEVVFMPKPMNGFFEGNKFLIPICTKYPGLHVAPMPYGVTPMVLPHLGFSFANDDGVLTSIVAIRVVPVDGYTLIEGVMTGDPAIFSNGQTGRNDGVSHLGFVNIKNGFSIDLPFDLPFTKNQTIYAGEFHDDPATNGFGRYLEDIPGWVGKYDWGEPLRIDDFTLSPFSGS